MIVSGKVLAGVLLMVPATWSSMPATDGIHAPTTVRASTESGAAREVVRLRAHFDSVDAKLRTSTPATLRPSQRAARAQLVGWLREYRDAGVFPKNDRFAGRMVPFFVDHRGVRCAMGELLHRSGRTDIVQAVAATRNNAYIADLADDPRLVAWLDSVGMTVAEAARVQPAYDGGGGNIIDDVEVTPASGTYKGIATALGVSSLAAIALNARRPSGLSAWAGLTLGTASVLTGSLRRGKNIRGEEGFTSASIALGVASFFAGAYRAFYPRRAQPSARETASRISDLQLTPALVPVGGGRRRPGLTVSATFR